MLTNYDIIVVGAGLSYALALVHLVIILAGLGSQLQATQMTNNQLTAKLREVDCQWLGFSTFDIFRLFTKEKFDAYEL